jgi:tRNA(Ile)-lysidine synthase
MVADLCRQLGVAHEIITIEWEEPPTTAIQERAREARYAALGDWIEQRGLGALVTAHHADDQAETLVMRLNRGAGVRGLAGMRPASTIPGCRPSLLRPLLGWRRAELEAICAAAGLTPATDPSNADERFERVRVRDGLKGADWLDPEAMTRSAGHLASADEAIGWAAEQEWERAVTTAEDHIAYRPSAAPAEIVRRIVARAIAALAHEGSGEPLRGRDLEPVIAALEASQAATLRGVMCGGGKEWRFSKAPPRKTGV